MVSGGRFRDSFAGDFVFIFYGFFFGCFVGGSVSGVQKCSCSWDYWVLVVHSSKFVAVLVIGSSPLMNCLNLIHAKHVFYAFSVILVQLIVILFCLCLFMQN